MKIAVNNRQSHTPVAIENIRRLAEFFMEKTAALTLGAEWGTVSVMLADDLLISEINATYLNKLNTTDVISFDLGPIHPGKARDAEIIVNVERACKTGGRHKGTTHELALYIAHACNHLSGADDATAPERRKMRSRELRWIKDAGTSGMLDNLFGKRAEKT